MSQKGPFNELATKAWDSIIEFLGDKAKDLAESGVSDKLEQLRTDRAFEGDIKRAIEKAAQRFETEYHDKDIAQALCGDTKFYDLPSIYKAVSELLKHPFDTVPAVTIEENFASALPKGYQHKANQAAQYFLEKLREELLGIKQVQDTLKMAIQLASLKKKEEIANTLNHIYHLFAPKPQSLDPVLAKYLDYVIDLNMYVDPRGIRQTRRSLALKLDEVYVSLNMETDAGSDWRSDKRLSLMRDENTTGHNDEIEEWMEQRQWALTLSERKNINVELPQVMREHARIVILGDPGAGKTTILRFLALHFALTMKQNLNGDGEQKKEVFDKYNNSYGEVRLPIFIRIALYADAFAKNRNLSLREFIPTLFGDINAPENLKAELLCNALQNGHALLLLDGLDEVIDPGDRIQIAGRIDDFVISIHSQNRFFVSSRIAGYRSAPLNHNFKHFTLCELERLQIEKFLSRWCYASEKFHTPDLSDELISCEAKIKADDILDAVDNNIGVKRLASNPLMLTILALIHRTGARLPSRRIELYVLAVQTLLEDWQLARGIKRENIVKEGEALRILGPLAYWLHTQKAAGMANERDVKEKLAEILAADRNRSPESGEIQDIVDDFLQRVREHTGIFVERAPGYYGFMHLTFEEYFTARELVRNYRETSKRIDQFRHHPRWEEPILLAIAYESNSSPERASDLIREAILAEGEDAKRNGFNPSQFEDILHRDLLLATKCIADCASVDNSLQELIIDRLLNIYFDEGHGKYEPLQERIVSSLKYLANSELEDALIIKVVRYIHNCSSTMRKGVANLLGGLSNADAAVINGLLNLLKDEDIDVRGNAALALGNLSNADAVVINGLLGLLKDEDIDVRGNAASALGNLSNADTTVINGLMGLFKDEDIVVRDRAGLALASLSNADTTVINKLVNLLKDEDIDVRGSAASALGNLSNADAAVINGLIDLLKDENNYVKSSAGLALGKLSNADTTAINRLLDLLKDEDIDVRIYVALALGNLSNIDATAINRLIDLLKDEDGRIRSSAGLALGSLSNVDVAAINRLLDLLKDKDIDVRRKAASALGNLSNIDAAVINRLIDLLKDENSHIRNKATLALKNLSNINATAINRLLDLLKDEDIDVRGNAALALGNLSNADAVVINGLIDLLKDEATSVRSSAAEVLGKLSSASLNVLNGLLQLLEGKNIPESYAYIWALMKILTKPVKFGIRPQVNAFLLKLRILFDEANHEEIVVSGNYYPHAYDLLWEALWTVSQRLASLPAEDNNVNL